MERRDLNVALETLAERLRQPPAQARRQRQRQAEEQGDNDDCRQDEAPGRRTQAGGAHLPGHLCLGREAVLGAPDVPFVLRGSLVQLDATIPGVHGETSLIRLPLAIGHR